MRTQATKQKSYLYKGYFLYIHTSPLLQQDFANQEYSYNQTIFLLPLVGKSFEKLLLNTMQMLFFYNSFLKNLKKNILYLFQKTTYTLFWQKITRKKNHKYWVASLLLPFVLFFVLDFFFPFKPQITYSQLILAQDSTVLHAYLTKDQKWRLKTDLHEISPLLRKTIIHKEDKYFYYHFGINPLAVLRAFANNWLQFKTTSGASTITMQVARLLAPKNRNYGNKLIEMFRALQLEWQYSKEEILQLYLNLVPYGGNIEGVKSASLLYFNLMPSKLNLAQITTLAIIPNRPTSLVLGKKNELIKKERNKWLKRFQKNRVFSVINIQNALKEPLTASRLSAPKFAPHFCQLIRQMYPNESNIYTALIPIHQRRIEELTFQYIQRITHLNIHNAAVLVRDNRTNRVVAYIGSPDFEDKFNAGEVDGVQAVRSPGSTLKPLVYALAMDKGILTPKRILTDVPSVFSGFEPENFFKNFSGNITAEQALIQSLNIPAVKILENIGIQTLIQKLKEANFKQIHKDEKKLGLSMVLGGCGVTLQELTDLFAVFASKGEYNPILYLMKDSVSKKISLISPESAFMISEILTQATRPDLPIGFENTLRIPKIAWKTGTSFGRRDAWSIGYNAHYTIGVWIGNFSGEGVNELVGAEVATPLLFEIFNLIDYNVPKNWFNAPAQLKPRWVCSESGLIPNTFCTHQVMDYAIPLISSTQKCTHQKEVTVSLDKKISYCISCRPLSGYQTALYPNLSSELMAFYEGKGIQYLKIPPHNVACTRIFDAESPTITSPSADKEYIIDRDGGSQIQLICQTNNEVKKVYWYINEEFYKTSSPNEAIFFTPQIGFNKISCSDDKGGNTSIQIKVVYE